MRSVTIFINDTKQEGKRAFGDGANTTADPIQEKKGAARDDAKISADPFREKMGTVHDDTDTSGSRGNGGTS